MATRSGSLVLLLSLALASTSCSYVKNRTNDLLDVFTMDVDVGLWPSVDLRASDYFGIGLGYSDQMIPLVNVHGRYIGQMPRRTVAAGAVATFTFYEDDETMQPILRDSGRYDSKEMQPPANFAAVVPTYVLEDYHPEKRGLRVADLGVSASLGLGVGVRLSPGELLDFALGLFGIDIADDDRFPALTVPSLPEVPK